MGLQELRRAERSSLRRLLALRRVGSLGLKRRMHPLERPVVAAAAVLIGATCMALGARFWWVFDLATHFRLQYVVAALVLLVPLALRRRVAWCVALLGTLALNGAALVAYPPIQAFARAPGAAATRPGAAEAAVRIASANLFFRNTGPGRLAPILEAAAPDVVVLEEFTPDAQRELGGWAQKYPYRVEKPAHGPYGIALLSRYPLEDARSFMLGSTVAIEARVVMPASTFTIIGVHLRSPVSGVHAAARDRQLGLLAAERRHVAGPVVVIGDFNLAPFSPHYADWLAAAHLEDARRHRMYLPTWPTFLPILGIPIDHCFVSSEFRVAGLGRLAAFGSDHVPLLADLLLEGPEAPPSRHH